MRAQNELLTQGFSLLPCNPRTKAPCIPRGSRGASCNAAQVSAWWSAMPDALIGVATGGPAGLFVLDFDEYRKDAQTAAWLYEHKDELDTFTYQTRGNGLHFVFRSPPGLIGRNSQGVVVDGRKLAGLDLRGDGGYVIHWPSHGMAVVNPAPIADIGWDFFHMLHQGPARQPIAA